MQVFLKKGGGGHWLGRGPPHPPCFYMPDEFAQLKILMYTEVYIS